MTRLFIFLSFLLFCKSALAENKLTWFQREEKILQELNAAFKKFKLPEEQKRFESIYKDWKATSEKTCLNLYEAFKQGTAYSELLQACSDRATINRLSEMHAIHFQTLPKPILNQIREWLKAAE